MSLANLTIVTTDGRESKLPYFLKFVCPPAYFAHQDAYGMQCLHCPQGQTGISSTLGLNEPASMCYCTAGHYGTFGDKCVPCPRSAGFACLQANNRWPPIKPGFYIDYDLLPSCVGQDTCDAIVECAFGEKACPGRGNKDCFSDDTTCYQGLGCTKCCLSFYQSGSDCLPCPNVTVTIVLFSLLAVAAVCVALLVTSIQTPQLQAAMKGIVVMTSFFQGFVRCSIPKPQISDLKTPNPN